MNFVKNLAIVTGFATLLAVTTASLAESHSGSKHGRYQGKIIEKLNLDEQQQALLKRVDCRTALWQSGARCSEQSPHSTV